MAERYDLGNTAEFRVPDMVGEPLSAWRAWRMDIEMREVITATVIDLDGKLPPFKEQDRRPVITLNSVNQGFAWEPRKVMVGICNPNLREKRKVDHEDSEVPMEGCSCGIHAMDSPLFLAKTGYVSMIGPGKSDFLWGEIAMWGKIINGTTGIKSQFAYPKELFIRPDVSISYKNDLSEEIVLGYEDLKDILAVQYGVPVEVVRTLKRPDPKTDEIVFKLFDGTSISRGGGKDGNR